MRTVLHRRLSSVGEWVRGWANGAGIAFPPSEPLLYIRTMTGSFPKPASFRSIPSVVRYFLLATLLGLVLGALGPFGSYMNDGLPMRAAYWVMSLWVGVLVYGVAVKIAARFTNPGTRAGLLMVMAAVLFASLPQALITRALALQMWPRLADLDLPWTIWYLQVALVSLLITLGVVVAFAWSARHRKIAQGDKLLSAHSAPAQRLANLAPDILALQMEDHYVRVHTSSGSELVLMPLGQAIANMGKKEGIRTHRSWWVARDAVERIDGTPRSMSLRLSNGIVAPVARSSVATLRLAGWMGGNR